jgi:hypothetical protein
MAPWKLPLIVAAVVVPIVAAFMIGGPGVGVAIGALATVAIFVVAVRQRPLGPIVSAPADDSRRHVLIIAVAAVEDPADLRRVAALTELGEGEPDVLVLVPARIGFLDRWASDVESARHTAQEHLVATVAALAKAGIAAEARVGDEDIVQATEDQLQSFPATEVVLVGGGEEDGVEAAAAELRSRLQARFREVRLGDGDEVAEPEPTAD